MVAFDTCSLAVVSLYATVTQMRLFDLSLVAMYCISINGQNYAINCFDFKNGVDIDVMFQHKIVEWKRLSYGANQLFVTLYRGNERLKNDESI